jgi:Cd2+/Zn2+-exporting ATPase
MIKYRLFLLGIVLGIISIIEICYLVNKQSSLVAIIFAIGIVAIAGIPILKNTLQALKSLTININVLMLLAIVGALFLHDFIEAAMITVLFNISEVIEDYSISVAKASVTNLFELVPKTARLWNADNWQIIVTNEIAVGDTIRVLPTEKIPVDGIVISGVSCVNQAQITGESVPVTKAEDDIVYAGSINDNGVLDIVATSIAKESTVAKIIKLIEEVQQVQAPTQKIIDRFAKYYTPIIFVIALGYAVIPPLWFGQDVQEYVYRSLLLLVISCPCALVISIPVAVINGLIVAAKNGIIIKGGIHLENGYRLKSIAFDKTGTLTKGEQSIETVVAFQNPKLANILQIAGSISQYSLHPIARAIFAHSQTKSDNLLAVKDFKEIVGGGTSGGT